MVVEQGWLLIAAKYPRACPWDESRLDTTNQVYIDMIFYLASTKIKYTSSVYGVLERIKFIMRPKSDDVQINISIFDLMQRGIHNKYELGEIVNE